jgi:hypothetical protein
MVTVTGMTKKSVATFIPRGVVIPVAFLGERCGHSQPEAAL